MYLLNQFMHACTHTTQFWPTASPIDFDGTLSLAHTHPIKFHLVAWRRVDFLAKTRYSDDWYTEKYNVKQRVELPPNDTTVDSLLDMMPMYWKWRTRVRMKVVSCIIPRTMPCTVISFTGGNCCYFPSAVPAIPTQSVHWWLEKRVTSSYWAQRKKENTRIKNTLDIQWNFVVQ